MPKTNDENMNDVGVSALPENIGEASIFPQIIMDVTPIQREAFEATSADPDGDMLRMQFPFLPINPPVGAVNAVVLVTATPTKELYFPPGAKLVRFAGVNEFYVNFKSGALKPTTDIQNGSAPILAPEGWYECSGVNSVSVYSATNGAVVTAEFYIQK